jgi:hypothetical protein
MLYDILNEGLKDLSEILEASREEYEKSFLYIHHALVPE